MDIETFARLEIAQGSPVIFHEGVWWRRVKPFYSWPLHILQAFPRGHARPPFLFSGIGFQHPVPETSQANSSMAVMLLHDLCSYSLAMVSHRKRTQIRRGLENVEVRRIEDMRDLIGGGLEINRSALQRQAWGGDRSGYLDPGLWRETNELAHSLGARESWGAYVDGKLVAYLRSFTLEDSVYITQTMSHTDYLKYYPNEALLHTFMTKSKEEGKAKNIIFGLDCAKTSLNEFKTRFGFQAVKIATYRWLNPAARIAARFTRYRHYLYGDVNGLPQEE